MQRVRILVYKKGAYRWKSKKLSNLIIMIRRGVKSNSGDVIYYQKVCQANPERS